MVLLFFLMSCASFINEVLSLVFHIVKMCLLVTIYFYIALKGRWGLLLSLLWKRQESPWIVQGDIYCQLQSMHIAFNDLWTYVALPPGPPTYYSTSLCLYLSSCTFTCPDT